MSSWGYDFTNPAIQALGYTRWDGFSPCLNTDTEWRQQEYETKTPHFCLLPPGQYQTGMCLHSTLIRFNAPQKGRPYNKLRRWDGRPEIAASEQNSDKDVYILVRIHDELFVWAKVQELRSYYSCKAQDCSEPATKGCARCRKQKYCSGQCQKKDWPTHKLVCVHQSSTSALSFGPGLSLDVATLPKPVGRWGKK